MEYIVDGIAALLIVTGIVLIVRALMLRRRQK